MEDVPRLVPPHRADDLVESLEYGIIQGRGGAARVGPDGQVAQVDRQDRGLHRVQSAVHADGRVVVLLRRPVIRDLADAVGQRGVGRQDGTAVAERAEVLGRVERERPDGAERARRAPAPRRPDGLRGVLDDGEVVGVADRAERRHVGALAEEVDRNNGLRALRDGGVDACRVQVERVRVDVGEDGRRAEQRGGLGRGDERERRADHLVARANAERHQRDLERVGPVGDAEGVDLLVSAEARDVGRQILLEGGHEGTAHERAAVQHGGDGGVDLGAGGVDLRPQVDHLEGHAVGGRWRLLEGSRCSGDAR